MKFVDFFCVCYRIKQKILLLEVWIKMNNIQDSYERTGILPVINIPEIELAVPVAKALIDGGLNAIEITLRSGCSLEAIEEIKKAYPKMIVGAGTVLSEKQVDDALSAGADYIVSPGYDEELVDYCIKLKVPIVPGCSSPSEIQRAVKKGLKVLKFFPGELGGGVEAIKLLSGPFPGVKFLPTGGINYGNLGQYLACDKVIACGGSYMATSEQIKNHKFEEITENCKKAVAISLGFELAHIGVNNDSEQEAEKGAEDLGKIFGLTVKKGNSSIFAGTAVEMMKMKFYGDKGHIGFRTNSVKRALAWFEDSGIEINEESIRYDGKGELVSAYIKQQVNGFAVHVVRK